MAVYFVSRHFGAIAWMKKQNIHVDHWIEHLDILALQRGDIVIGVLPVHIAAQLSEMGVAFYALSIEQSLATRGQELSAEDLDRLQCHLHRYEVKKIGNPK